MSPEQCEGETVDHRSDLFSLGAVMFRMATGQLPFKGQTAISIIRQICDREPESLSELNPDLPEWLRAVILKLLEKSPHKRFQSADELIAALQSGADVPFGRRSSDRATAGRFTRVAAAAVVLLGLSGLLAVGLELSGVTDFFGVATARQDDALGGGSQDRPNAPDSSNAPGASDGSVTKDRTVSIEGGAQSGTANGAGASGGSATDAPADDRFWPAHWLADSGQRIGAVATSDAAAADLDHDGDLDVVVANGTFNNPQANRVLLNDGSGFLEPTEQLIGNSISSGVALGDVNGDRHIDAFFANWSDRSPEKWGRNSVWLNDGSGHLTDTGQDFGSRNSRHVALGDLDGDGDLDAWVANYRERDCVWLNDGQGNFTEHDPAVGQIETFRVALADLDGDGDLDAVLAGAFRQLVQVWLNDGNASFTQHVTLGDEIAVAIVAVDVDADSDIDLIVRDKQGLALYRNSRRSRHAVRRSRHGHAGRRRRHIGHRRRHRRTSGCLESLSIAESEGFGQKNGAES
jgi:hypothetical protein